MIRVEQTFTADSADALAGTDLENVPPGGALALLVGSTQADTILTVTTPMEKGPVRSQLVRKKTDGVPLENEDPVIPLMVPEGGKVVVDINIVTGATVVLTAIWMPLGEAALMV